MTDAESLQCRAHFLGPVSLYAAINEGILIYLTGWDQALVAQTASLIPTKPAVQPPERLTWMEIPSCVSYKQETHFPILLCPRVTDTPPLPPCTGILDPPHLFRKLFPLHFQHRCLKSALTSPCVTQAATSSQRRVYIIDQKAPYASFIFLHNCASPHMTEEIFCKQFSYPPNAYLMEVFSEKHYKNFQIETISIHSNLHLLFPISKPACSALILTPACSSKPSAGELATQLPLETTGAIKFDGEKITWQCLKLGGTTLCF